MTATRVKEKGDTMSAANAGTNTPSKSDPKRLLCEGLGPGAAYGYADREELIAALLSAVKTISLRDLGADTREKFESVARLNGFDATTRNWRTWSARGVEAMSENMFGAYTDPKHARSPKRKQRANKLASNNTSHLKGLGSTETSRSATDVTLSEPANAHAEKINGALQKSLEAILEAGALLIAAKEDLGHGEFLLMVSTELAFGEDTAQRLMSIARDTVLSNTEHARYLPSSWSTLFELTRVNPTALKKALAEGAVHPEMTRKDAKALAAPKRVTVVDPEVVLAGELSPHAVMLEAGLRRRTITIDAEDIHRAIHTLLHHYPADEVISAVREATSIKGDNVTLDVKADEVILAMRDATP